MKSDTDMLMYIYGVPAVYSQKAVAASGYLERNGEEG
jgi:hypothetical protein